MKSTHAIDIHQQIKALKKDYVESLPDKIHTLRDQLTKDGRGELRETFHKIKGSGATYGCPEVSILCAVMESLCEDPSHPIKKTVPLALNILTDIHSHRKVAPLDDNQSYSLETDSRFLTLKKFLL